MSLKSADSSPAAPTSRPDAEGPRGRLTLLWRALARQCPRCGEASLFEGYLKRRDRCPACCETFVGLDADDGPAWLTIGVVAHIAIPALILLERRAALTYAMEFAIVATLAIGATLLALPVAKSVFIVALWTIRRAKG